MTTHKDLENDVRSELARLTPNKVYHVSSSRHEIKIAELKGTTMVTVQKGASILLQTEENVPLGVVMDGSNCIYPVMKETVTNAVELFLSLP